MTAPPDPGAVSPRSGPTGPITLLQARDKRDEDYLLPRTGMTLAEARRQISGRHFAKEALDDSERELLYIAEALLRVVDGEALG